MNRLASLPKRFPFTTLWLVSYLVMAGGGLLMEQYGEASIPSWLLVVWRILIVPAYMAMLAVSLLGAMLFGSVEATPAWYPWISLPLQVAPFVAVDLLLSGPRRIESVSGSRHDGIVAS